jgi:hypothetical protein
VQQLNAAFQALRDRMYFLGAQVITHLPEVIGAVVIIAAGWLAGIWLRRLTIRLGERVSARVDHSEDYGGPKASPALLRLVANVVLWGTVILFATIAVDVAGLDIVVVGLGQLLGYLPNLLLGLFIIAGGYLASAAVRALVSDALLSANVPHRAPIARMAQMITLLGAVVIGIDQMGVKVALITTALNIALGTFLAGLALAFGLGARPLVSNLIGAQHARRYIRQGERARIGEFTGEIVELTPTGIVLASDEGRVHVPASRFHDEPLVILPPQVEPVSEST